MDKLKIDCAKISMVLMVRGKADASVPDINGDPPLIIAARQGGPLIIAALLDNRSGHQLISTLLTFYSRAAASLVMV